MSQLVLIDIPANQTEKPTEIKPAATISVTPVKPEAGNPQLPLIDYTPGGKEYVFLVPTDALSFLSSAQARALCVNDQMIYLQIWLEAEPSPFEVQDNHPIMLRRLLERYLRGHEPQESLIAISSLDHPKEKSARPDPSLFNLTPQTPQEKIIYNVVHKRFGEKRRWRQ